jgi:oligopeptide/dipeptide ABC transporter ATP-binding protein
MNKQNTILSVHDLHVELGGNRRLIGADIPPVKAVGGVTFSLEQGEIFGLIGESGCGKTTLGRTILGMQRQSSGSVMLSGQPVDAPNPREARRKRASIQYLHQDAAAALDPWWSIGRTLREASIVSKAPRHAHKERIRQALEDVGLTAEAAERYPHELSGGQLRRVALARILLLQPRIVILDEPTAGLDMSIQSTILNLLLQLRERHKLTYLFISHDLSVVERLCDQVAIMYLGRIVETASARDLFEAPLHPYTQALLRAVPRLDQSNTDRQVERLTGEPPSIASLPPGCTFAPRCPYAQAQCSAERPVLSAAGAGHRIACWRWRDLLRPAGQQGAELEL